MPGTNLEIVRRSLEAFNAFMRGDEFGEAFAEAHDREVVVEWTGDRIYPDTPRELRGVRSVLAFTEQYRDGWVDLSAEPLELTEAPDDRVFGLLRQSGRGRQSGVPIVIHYFAVWTIRNGTLRKVQYFRHRADAMEAAGLEE